MNDFLPDKLPPVHYFLAELNNDTWINIIRIFFAVIAAITVFVYFYFRSKPANSDKINKERETFLEY